MLQWEAPAFESPFELWREEGVLHLVLAKGGCMRIGHMKEILRLIAALDTSGRVPVMIDHAQGVVVEEDARRLLTRVCREQGHPVAVYSTDRDCRNQLDVFRQVHKPSFPFRVFERREEAFRWARERRQLSALEGSHNPRR
ncbi:MAG: hypothetical protein KA941_08835 [Flavobacteriales bacterium]|nr:hypothetical protein [Flavobacteriales bacterium]